MTWVKNFLKTLIILPFCCLMLVSCSKEEEEVPLVDNNAPSYDVGYLTIKFTGLPFKADSVVYINTTKSVSNTVNTTFGYDQVNDISFLSIPLANGHKNDQLQCCVSLNDTTNIGIAFTNVPLDSITTVFTSSSNFCQSGTY